MRPILLLHIILLFSFPAIGQGEVNTDSLRAVMQSRRPYEQQIDAAVRLTESYQLKNFDSAILVGDQALQLARKHTDSVRVAELKRYIGVANYFSGKYDVAARHFLESISILEKEGEKKKLAPVYNELAKLYRKTRDLDKALLTYNKAGDLYRQLRDTGGIAMILNESGVVFEYMYDYREAIERYTSSMRLAENAGDSLSVSYSLSNLAGVYVIQKNFDAAIRNLQRALRIREQLKDSFALALTYSDLGAAYNSKGDYRKAIDYLGTSNRIAEKLRYPELQSNNYNELSSAASRQGDYQKAFAFFTRRAVLRDSLFALEKTKEIEKLSTQYETAKKEQQIREQQNQIRLQNYLFAGLGLFILLAGLLIYSYYKRYRLKKESQLQSALLQQQEAATRAILEAEENERQRIARELHDGIGQMMSAAKMNLSAMESALPAENAEVKDSLEKAISLVDDSCREIRTVSHFMMPNALLKNNLGQAVKEFVNKIGRRELQVEVYTEGLDERMDANLETVLYRVVQECVHNCLKHAGASRLDISLIRDAEGISGTIEDNGRGFETEQSDSADGIGLKNIRTRISYLKGSVEITSSPGKGTLVAFHVPT